MWTWFNGDPGEGDVGGQPIGLSARTGLSSIYDTTMTEIGRWNFYSAWPSKIANDGFEVTKNDPVHESITHPVREARAQEVTGVRTEFEFVLPRGYLDESGTLHKRGIMRLATARGRAPTVAGPNHHRT